jgi:hypothetical protein
LNLETIQRVHKTLSLTDAALIPTLVCLSFVVGLFRASMTPAAARGAKSADQQPQDNAALVPMAAGEQAVVVAGRRSTPLTMKQLTKHETRQTANKHKINNNDNNNDDDNDNDNNKNNNKNNSPHQRREEGGGAGQ